MATSKEGKALDKALRGYIRVSRGAWLGNTLELMVSAAIKERTAARERLDSPVLIETLTEQIEILNKFRSADPKESVFVRTELGPCQVFVLCDRPATTTMDHPTLGPVPACERCKAKLS